MRDALWQRLQLLVSVLSVLLLLMVLAAGWFWWHLRGSLPVLDGTLGLPGLTAPVRIERDGLGVPTITGTTRADVARATGFLHAQDRFFQMDLRRRSGAGELAALFGPAALPVDRAHRLHRFRTTAETALAHLPTDQRALLEAYTAGVNAGLAALRQPPWEYLVLRTDPAPWQVADSLLVIYAMWFDLQDSTGQAELSRRALRDAIGQSGVNFLAPPGTSWDSALDGSTFAPAPLPALRLSAPDNQATASSPPTEARPIGSNSFAVAGSHTTGGGALLANDMHLPLDVPTVWYRAVLAWSDAAGAPHRVVGVTLPGLPNLVTGSNGHVAWGYTNAYVDTTDVVVVETETTAGAFYRTTDGYKEIADHPETIQVKGGDPVTLTSRWSDWGPIIGAAEPGRLYALRWSAHDPVATDLAVLGLETTVTVDEALAIGRHAGMPNQNLVAADTTGAIGWTVTGRIPRRLGHDGRYPVSWAYGDRRWDGWLDASEVPVILNPPEGILWTANQRLLGGAAGAKLGDGGYANGARGAQIRDDLRALLATGRPATPADLLAIQLDDRALFLVRWQQFLLSVLDPDALAANPERRELRDAVMGWDGRAAVDSAACHLVDRWRQNVAQRTLAPFYAQPSAHYPDFSPGSFHSEDALWQLVHKQPARLLNPGHATWTALLLAAADDVLAEADHAGVAPARLTQGRANTLHMRHPLSRSLPGFLAGFLDQPPVPLPGGRDLPRVQTPEHGASERMVVEPGREAAGLFHMPGGQSGHPLSPYYRAGHDAWVHGDPTPLLPGPTQHTLLLEP